MGQTRRVQPGPPAHRKGLGHETRIPERNCHKWRRDALDDRCGEWIGGLEGSSHSAHGRPPPHPRPHLPGRRLSLRSRIRPFDFSGRGCCRREFRRRWCSCLEPSEGKSVAPSSCFLVVPRLGKSVKTKAGEVAVEGKGLLNSFPLHDRERQTVHIAEFQVDRFPENLEGLSS